jgi:hypothetical protein
MLVRQGNFDRREPSNNRSPMSSSPRGSLGFRLVAEFCVIIVGVLVALQFEGWRDLRRDGAREAEQLEALLGDFQSNVSRLEQTASLQRRVLDASRILLEDFERGRSIVPPDSLAELYAGALSWYALEPVTGAYDALIASGDIGLLQSTELRRHLAEFYGEIAAGFEDHENEMDVLALMLDESKDVLLGLAPQGYGVEDLEGATPEAAALLVANRSVGGLLAWKVLLARNRLRRLEMLAAAADSIVLTIEGRR